uniref:AlNc14C30G2848 protein n=1 Tax=Albugo laibachii Nc14 TaxID=890382 RepID=F0W7P4_9STRA|nr:AlNc14C30G2848 [Albugo laibachii Nc14]|eukprot:CCA17145.1 AlNc14C30G2848 [Albugo laibachii Nc14]
MKSKQGGEVSQSPLRPLIGQFLIGKSRVGWDRTFAGLVDAGMEDVVTGKLKLSMLTIVVDWRVDVSEEKAVGVFVQPSFCLIYFHFYIRATELKTGRIAQW